MGSSSRRRLIGLSRSWRVSSVAVVAFIGLLSGGSGPLAVAARSQVPVGAPPVTGVNASPEPAGSEPTAASAGAVVGAATTVPAVNVAAPVGGALPPATSPTSAVRPNPNADVTSTSSTSSLTSSSSSTAVGRLTKSTTTKPAAVTVDDLRLRIAALMDNSTAASIGALVVIDGGPTIFAHNADSAMIPASTQKMYIAGAALAALGVDARFTTDVLASGAMDGSTLRGDLVVRASGDPSFTSTDLNALAASVRATGLTSVTGRLVIDDTRFDRQARVATWKAKFSPGEAGWLSAFSVDGNHRSDTETVADASLANLSRFRDALRAKGVTIVGAEQRGVAGPSATPIAAQRSAALQDLVRTFMKKSDNTYAELITKELGARQGVGSTAAGVQAIASYFSALNVVPPSVQEDGSGLSLNNRSSARVQVRYLQKALASPTGSALRSSLAVSCVDGTLKSRTCGTAAAGKVFAKTGSIDYVVALTGVTTTGSGKPVTFSFLLNSVRSPRLARSAIDAALQEIVGSQL